eukprot:scaffold2535_cov336-Prasinococcus_capsulatus_cf.AAC.2
MGVPTSDLSYPPVAGCCGAATPTGQRGRNSSAVALPSCASSPYIAGAAAPPHNHSTVVSKRNPSSDPDQLHTNHVQGSSSICSGSCHCICCSRRGCWRAMVLPRYVAIPCGEGCPVDVLRLEMPSPRHRLPNLHLWQKCEHIRAPPLPSRLVLHTPLRHVNPAWCGQADSADEYQPAMNTAFMRLFDYISGENEQNVEIAMTAPVLSKLTPGQGPFCSNAITVRSSSGMQQRARSLLRNDVSFFMPFDFQDNPPKPSSPDCFLTYMPAMDVYVSSFSTPPPGPDGDTVISQAYSAVNGLAAQGVTVSDTPFFVAAYDPPFRLVDRHDEIWLLPETSQSTAASRKLKL